jgi:hypothetical protein
MDTSGQTSGDGEMRRLRLVEEENRNLKRLFAYLKLGESSKNMP